MKNDQAIPPLPYDGSYPRVEKERLTSHEYVVRKERLAQAGAYALNMGAFVHFALSAFPVLFSEK